MWAGHGLGKGRQGQNGVKRGRWGILVFGWFGSVWRALPLETSLALYERDGPVAEKENRFPALDDWNGFLWGTLIEYRGDSREERPASWAKGAM